MEAAFAAGELDWTKVREAARVVAATGEDEELWTRRARELRYPEIEQLAQQALGEPVRVRRSLGGSPQQPAWCRGAVQSVREEHEGESVSLGAALAEICRRFAEGKVEGAGKRARVSIQLCPSCETATRETRAGTVEVAKASLERTLCDAEVLDTT